MSSRSILFLCVLAVAAGLAIWTLGDDEEAPLAFHRATIETARTGDATSLWYALPASYQDDIDACVQGFADKLDGYDNIYDRTFGLIGKCGQLLTEKKEYFLQSGALQEFAEKQGASPEEPPPTEVAGESNSAPKLTEVLAGHISSFANDALDLIHSLTDAMPEFPGAAVSDAKSTISAASGESKLFVENRSESTATIRIEVEGQDPIRQTVVLVEGKWVPSTVAERWSELAGKVKSHITALSWSEREKFFISTAFYQAEQAIDRLIAATSQVEFDRQLSQILILVGRL